MKATTYFDMRRRILGLIEASAVFSGVAVFDGDPGDLVEMDYVAVLDMSDQGSAQSSNDGTNAARFESYGIFVYLYAGSSGQNSREANDRAEQLLQGFVDELLAVEDRTLGVERVWRTQPGETRVQAELLDSGHAVEVLTSVVVDAYLT